ncbi:MAG TPA: hypothetical protein VF025_13795 [Gaiellaceae bacterium]
MSLRANWVAPGVLLAVLAAIALWNAYDYPSYAGFDVAEHQAYADLLIHHGQIPGSETRSEYYTPPGFYALAGVATIVGEHLHSQDPHKLAQYLNWLVLVATAVVLLLLARELFPRRPWLQYGALGYFCFLPVALKMSAMFHPEPLSMLASTLALLLAARILVRRAFRLLPAIALGAVLGAGQLVRAFSLWTFAAVVIAFGAAALFRNTERRAVLTTLGVVVAATAVVASPWYIRQTVHYGNPVFDRPTEDKPVWRRRPASFYVGLGLPQVFTDPIRPNYVNMALPTTYSDLWGDYFGVFGWDAAHEPTSRQKRELRQQSDLGLLPTLLALGGWVALIVTAFRRRLSAYLPVALLPGLGILGYLYFTVSYPTPDGDVLKASYMLTTAPAWAIAFGYAFEWVSDRGRLVRAALLVATVGSAALSIPFLVYGSPLGFL